MCFRHGRASPAGRTGRTLVSPSTNVGGRSAGSQYSNGANPPRSRTRHPGRGYRPVPERTTRTTPWAATGDTHDQAAAFWAYSVGNSSREHIPVEVGDLLAFSTDSQQPDRWFAARDTAAMWTSSRTSIGPNPPQDSHHVVVPRQRHGIYGENLMSADKPVKLGAVAWSPAATVAPLRFTPSRAHVSRGIWHFRSRVLTAPTRSTPP